jgi:hypothetical protein
MIPEKTVHMMQSDLLKGWRSITDTCTCMTWVTENNIKQNNGIIHEITIQSIKS